MVGSVTYQEHHFSPARYLEGRRVGSERPCARHNCDQKMRSLSLAKDAVVSHVVHPMEDKRTSACPSCWVAAVSFTDANISSSTMRGRSITMEVYRLVKQGIQSTIGISNTALCISPRESVIRFA